MIYEWHLNMKNVFELAEFMVESDQIMTAKDLLEYFKRPEIYTEVWNLYQQETHGKNPGSHRLRHGMEPPLPVMLALAERRTH